MIQIRRVWGESGQRYGVHKVWEQLKRDLVEIPGCRVERLIRKHGLEGVVYNKRIKTTVRDHGVLGNCSAVKNSVLT